MLRTEVLDIAYIDSGREHSPAALLLHGWPDDATTWTEVARRLELAGIRTIAPWLRGCGATRFLASETIRDGRTEALAQDAIDLMNGLHIDRFAVVGHDWGARTAYALAAVAPERVTSIVPVSVGYTPRGEFPVPRLEQSRAWWYQWFLSVDRGAEAAASDPKGFARIQWDTWSPPGWFDDSTFESVARSFENPDWTAIMLSAYRNRWREELRDARYDALSRKIAQTELLAVPTLMIQGSVDGTVMPKSTEAQDRYFTSGYRRVVLEGIGHFPTREAPDAVADLILEHIT